MKKIITLYLAILIVLSVFLFFEGQGITSSATEIPEYTCGDGICTVPLEDEVTCPEDCSEIEFNKFPIFLGALIVLFIGIFYFNFYRGKADLRKLTKGRNPFKSDHDYKQVYNYIASALKINMEIPEIVNKLYHKGWSKKQVVYTFEDFKWKQRKVLLETAPKVVPNLQAAEDYISSCRLVNIEDKRIKQALIAKGWKKSHIKKAFKNLVHS